MDKKRVGKIAGIAVLALVVLIGLLFAVGVLGVPDGGLEDNEWGEVDDERVEVITTIWVDNPNPFGIGGSVDVQYDVDLEGVRMAEGEGTDISISGGNNSLVFETDLIHTNLPQWWSAHLNNDEVSALEADATVHASAGPLSGSPSTTVEDEVETDIEGSLDDSFSEFEGAYPEVAPSFEIVDVTTEWGEVTESETEILLTMTIHNPEVPNPAPFPTPSFQGELIFNDITMAEWTAGDVEVLDAAADAMIGPGETAERTLSVTMNNERISPWFASHVENDEYTELVIVGQLVFDVDGTEVTIPPAGGIQCTFDLYTDIFVDQESGATLQSCGVVPPEDFGGTVGDDLDDLLDEDNGLLNGDNGLLNGDEEDEDNGLLNGDEEDEDNGLLNGDEEEDDGGVDLP